MLLSPNKNLSRSFLRSLKDNRFISPRGKEYCPEEVIELLMKKEMKYAEIEFNAELRQAKPQITIADMFAQMRTFQDKLFKRPDESARESPVEKNVSSDHAPLLFAPSQIFSLPEKDSLGSISAHQKDFQQSREPGPNKPGTLAEFTTKKDGGKMQNQRTPKYMFGCKVKSRMINYSLNEIKKERKRMEQVMLSLNNNRSPIGKSSPAPSLS